jgi:hypothetical protein
MRWKSKEGEGILMIVEKKGGEGGKERERVEGRLGNTWGEDVRKRRNFGRRQIVGR